MRPGAAALVGLGLLALGCGLGEPGAALPIYAPWEVGLTLTYEDPRLPEGQRQQARKQVRVASMKRSGDGFEVERVSSSLQGYAKARYLCRNGGLTELDENGALRGMILPAGFPGTVERWQGLGDGGSHHRLTLLGRATVNVPGLVLPATVNPVGVWMESELAQSDGLVLRRRSFLLPGIGETETWEWDAPSRRWVCINRLVARGFTDAPSGS